MGVTDPTEEYFRDGIWGWATDQWLKILATAGGLLKIQFAGQDADVEVAQTVAADLTPGIMGWNASGEQWQKLRVSAVTYGLQVETSIPGTSHAIHNVVMTSANTEYSRALAQRTKKFLIKCRGNYDIRVAFTSGESGTTYITIPAGMNYWEDLIVPTSLTLHFQCATAGQVVEIVSWN